VYVTVDEFSGRRPAVRGSARFHFASRDFDNPLTPFHYLTLTSGSRGKPTRVRRSLPAVGDIAFDFALALDAHGVKNPRNVFWRGAAPNWPIVHLKLGYPIDVWFTPTYPFPPLARVGTHYLRLLARLAGHHLPAPRHCDLQDAETVARWLVDHPGNGRPVLVNSTVSMAVRIAAAANSMGRRLDGLIFHARSEPLSEARRRQIEQVGGRVIGDYASMELSALGYSCATSVHPDDLHFFSERHALVERQRPAFEGGPTIDALLFTTLTRTASKIALNVESGDSAQIDVRECGCALGSLGLRTHLSDIRSFEKLSTEGTSFARSNLVQILEEILPARFGGVVGSYQLAEEESADGSRRLMLRVHPSLSGIDEDVVRSVLLAEMARGSIVDEHQAELIRRAESVVVARTPPLETATGKVLPFQVLKPAGERDRVPARSSTGPDHRHRSP
jgi:hypothetical protein